MTRLPRIHSPRRDPEKRVRVQTSLLIFKRLPFISAAAGFSDTDSDLEVSGRGGCRRMVPFIPAHVCPCPERLFDSRESIQRYGGNKRQGGWGWTAFADGSFEMVKTHGLI